MQETNNTQNKDQQQQQQDKSKAIKQQKQDIIWDKVERGLTECKNKLYKGGPDKLQGVFNIISLKQQLDKNKQIRNETNDMVQDIKRQYGGLKQNIKTFIQQQNKTSNKLTLPNSKKKAPLKTM